MPRPDAAPKETEERILEAALQEFSMKGKDGARTQDIADRAGINKALLHYYFRSKDRLYDRVFEYMLSRLSQSFGSTLRDSRSFEEMLRLFIDRYIDFVGSNLAIMRLMVSEHLAGGERMADRLRHVLREKDSPPSVFLDRLTRAAAQGEIRPVDPHQTLVTVLSNCIFFFLIFPSVRVLAPAARQNPDLFIQQRKDHVFDLMWSWLCPAKPVKPTDQIA